jgi:hypothetical protein
MKQYQIEISNWFAALENFSDNEDFGKHYGEHKNLRQRESRFA